MASYVNTNVSSLNAQNKLTKVTNSLNTTYQRLSSGLRINSAKDDAAGLAISDRLTAHINGYNQGNRNANDGIALAQTAEGAMDEITNLTQRIRTLGVQAANGALTSTDRKAIATEVTQLTEEITRISCATTYAGAQILMGSASKGGILSSGKTTIHVGSLSSNSTVAKGQTIELDLSTNMKTDVADKLSAKFANTSGNYTQAKAEELIAECDTVLESIDTARGKLGAQMNRLQSTISNQSNISENLTDARSRIRDTDYAEEASNLSQQSIIQQAASSMLTQANARPQIALSLLG